MPMPYLAHSSSIFFWFSTVARVSSPAPMTQLTPASASSLYCSSVMYSGVGGQKMEIMMFSSKECLVSTTSTEQVTDLFSLAQVAVTVVLPSFLAVMVPSAATVATEVSALL